MKIGDVIQQGEVRIERIEKPEGLRGDSKPMVKTDKGFILAHSESGNHHLLDGGEVLELPQKIEGLKQFSISLKETQKLIQDATNPHKAHTLPAGYYKATICREYDPFTQQARRVMD